MDRARRSGYWLGRCAVSGARNNRAVKLRRLREGDVLDDGDVVLVRGGELDPDVLCADALRYYNIYGAYGISVFAIRGATLDEMSQQVPLIRFECLTLLKVREVVAAGLRLEPTGRNPRHFTVGFDDLDDGVRRLGGCDHQVVRNPFHDA
jgi:hypothetical protein